MTYTCKCGHKKSWHRGNQKQKLVVFGYPELFEKGNTYIRTCYGLACTCMERYEYTCSICKMEYKDYEDFCKNHGKDIYK